MVKPKLVIAADHAGFEMKEKLHEWLKDSGYEVTDKGTYASDSVDYPDFAHPLAEAIEKGEYDLGILICGSANGVAITANRHSGVRAAICWMEEVATVTRKHNNANVLCLPARFIAVEEAIRILDTFLHTEFEGGRHQRRIDKISC